MRPSSNKKYLCDGWYHSSTGFPDAINRDTFAAAVHGRRPL